MKTKRNQIHKLTVTGALAFALLLVPHAGLNAAAPAAHTAINCAGVSEIPQTECAALLDLYNATGGPDWRDSPANNWDVTTTPCTWSGVTCDSGHIIEIVRTSKGLSGTLPGSLDQLAELTLLDLADNHHLTGAIPPELGNLANLQQLDLWSNDLTGAIPPGLGNLANLQHLSLSMNSLTGAIPPELGNLTGLQVLSLSSNQLSGAIPPELGDLANLNFLSLFNNQLTGAIPPELGDLANLQELWLNHNNLAGAIPSKLGDLANLQSLGLYINQLSGAIPPELGDLANLQYLFLNSNQLTGAVPPALTQLTSLGEADLGYNGLWAQDQSASDFLDSKDSDWVETQTTPPTALWATRLADDSVRVVWRPIPYTQDGGHYQVHYSLTPGGPYTPASGVTVNKASGSYVVEGLAPGTDYYFVVNTFTPAHNRNTNPITSAFSNEVPTGAVPHQIFLPLVLCN